MALNTVRIPPWSPVSNGPTGAVPETFWEKIGAAATTAVNVLLVGGQLVLDGLVAVGSFLVHLGEAVWDWGMQALGEVQAAAKEGLEKAKGVYEAIRVWILTAFSGQIRDNLSEAGEVSPDLTIASTEEYDYIGDDPWYALEIATNPGATILYALMASGYLGVSIRAGLAFTWAAPFLIAGLISWEDVNEVVDDNCRRMRFSCVALGITVFVIGLAMFAGGVYVTIITGGHATLEGAYLMFAGTLAMLIGYVHMIDEGG